MYGHEGYEVGRVEFKAEIGRDQGAEDEDAEGRCAVGGLEGVVQLENAVTGEGNAEGSMIWFLIAQAGVQKSTHRISNTTKYLKRAFFLSKVSAFVHLLEYNIR